jgi:hypothetical protein
MNRTNDQFVSHSTDGSEGAGNSEANFRFSLVVIGVWWFQFLVRTSLQDFRNRGAVVSIFLTSSKASYLLKLLPPTVREELQREQIKRKEK